MYFRRIQQRMSCELLANLASYLLNDPTIFEIVNSLLDIQHIIEKELFHERIELNKKHLCKFIVFFLSLCLPLSMPVFVFYALFN